MRVIKDTESLRRALQERCRPVGLVPTMGALHNGHISLVKRCRTECATVVASVFVNPTQFNDPEDLKNYPRTPEADAAMLEAAGTDILFMPDTAEMYPEEDTRVFDFSPLDSVMEGSHRPGHFNGVAQIVSKLFESVRPDKAYFGEKDFQQLAIIRELNRRCGYGIQVIGCPTLRDSDGLALSSRNLLLTPEQRTAAPRIYRTLSEAATLSRQMTVEETVRWVTEKINASGQLKTEYFLITDEQTLRPIGTWDESKSPRGFVAVKAGKVRLIDNIKFH